MDKLFKLSLRGTDKKTEIIAGLTTFMTMAYVLAVQPAAICGGEAYITDVNGVVITKSAIMITCALVSGLITLLMAFYTNFPFALSTGMGSNFILGALIQSQALSFGAAMVITLISGIVFVLLTVFGLRDLIVRVIPKNIKIAISASIGFFIAYLGFKNCGIGSFENGIALGNLTDRHPARCDDAQRRCRRAGLRRAGQRHVQPRFQGRVHRERTHPCVCMFLR